MYFIIIRFCGDFKFGVYLDKVVDLLEDYEVKRVLDWMYNV